MHQRSDIGDVILRGMNHGGVGNGRDLESRPTTLCEWESWGLHEVLLYIILQT